MGLASFPLGISNHPGFTAMARLLLSLRRALGLIPDSAPRVRSIDPDLSIFRGMLAPWERSVAS